MNTYLWLVFDRCWDTAGWILKKRQAGRIYKEGRRVHVLSPGTVKCHITVKPFNISDSLRGLGASGLKSTSTCPVHRNCKNNEQIRYFILDNDE